MKRRLLVLVLAILLLLTVQVSADTVKTIRVTGTATVSVGADRAVISVGVRNTAPVAAEASAKNAETVEALKAALTEAGIQESDITTSYYYVNPVYDYSSTGTETLTGYQVCHTLSVMVRKLERTGDLIDLALSSGANTCDGVTFESSQAAAAYDQAVIQALKEGRRKAELIALGNGKILGELLGIEENYGSYGSVAFTKSAVASDMARGTDIAPESLDFSATVTMTFAFQ